MVEKTIEVIDQRETTIMIKNTGTKDREDNRSLHGILETTK